MMNDKRWHHYRGEVPGLQHVSACLLGLVNGRLCERAWWRFAPPGTLTQTTIHKPWGGEGPFYFSSALCAWSVFAAMLKSLRCSPPILCVHHATVTLPPSVSRSG